MSNRNHVEISIDKNALVRLINDNALSLNELHCLNQSAKQVVHKSFLFGLLAKTKREPSSFS